MSMDRLKNELGQQFTPILVFAVSGRIGSGASFVVRGLYEELRAFGYHPVEVDVTHKFLDSYEECGNEDQPSGFDDWSDAAQRIFQLQNKGNDLREKYGESWLSARCVDFIKDDIDNNKALSHPTKRAYIIDSLKHPKENELLRTIFRGSFYMIGVVADDNVRKRRLYDQKQISDVAFEAINKRDANEVAVYGQHSTKTILDADYFFENNYDTPQKIYDECKRLLNLIFQRVIVSPRQDEYGMHLAAMSADRSACLSRQVGAAILSESGMVLATGYNDVPKFGGGLYTSQSHDYRCFAKSRMCHNDYEKSLIATEIINSLKKSSIISDDKAEEVRRILSTETRLKDLIEFSRAVHAEMDAIMAVARSATSGLVGSTMYVTTYPCHNCAKHIIDAGIKRVVFMEPYHKSLAQKLHSDAINNPLEERNPQKVSFDNYSGVAPQRFSDFFSVHESRHRKKDGKLVLTPFKKSENETLSIPLWAQTVEELELQLRQFKEWFNEQRPREDVCE